MAAASYEEVVAVFGEQGTIGNVIGWGPGDVVITGLMCGVFVDAPGTDDDGVIVLAAFIDVIGGKDIIAYNAARFSCACDGARGHEIGVFEFFEFGFPIFEHDPGVFSSLDFGGGPVGWVGIVAGVARGVEVDVAS